MTYLILILEFFKVGLFSIGGGLATLPFLFELAGRYPWFTSAELTNMIAVAESTPGPIGVNMATYAGFKAYGVLGGIAASLALVLPSLVIILIIAGVLQRFKDSVLVKDVFYGLRASVAGLIAVSVLNVLLQNLTAADAQSILAALEWKKIVLFAALVFCVFKFKKHPLWYIGAGAVLGILFKL